MSAGTGPAGTLSRLLIRVAARRWPAELRDNLRREWLAELHAIEADGTVSPIRYALSLAVRRPERVPVTAPVPLDPVIPLLAPVLLLVLSLTATLVLGSTGPPLVAAAPALVVLFALVGYRVGIRADRTAPAGDIRIAARAIVIAVIVGYAFGLLGEGLPAILAALAWSVTLGWLIRLVVRARRGALWLAVAGGLALAYTAFTLSVLFRFPSGDAPRAYALAWFPRALAEPVMPIGPPMVADDNIAFEFVDFTELLPHSLLALGAYGLAYAMAVRRVAAERGASTTTA